MRQTIPILALAVVLLIANPAHAAETCYTTSTTDEREVVLEVPVQDDPLGVSFVAHYVVIDTFCMPGVGDASCLMSVYVYPESNNVPGLQRCDEVKCDTQDCEPWQPGPDYDGL